eukprot:scaffold1461_cov253-Pinguiococcus_pyrenoidosus.AAC.28
MLTPSTMNASQRRRTTSARSTSLEVKIVRNQRDENMPIEMPSAWNRKARRGNLSFTSRSSAKRQKRNLYKPGRHMSTSSYSSMSPTISAKAAASTPREAQRRNAATRFIPYPKVKKCHRSGSIPPAEREG